MRMARYFEYLQSEKEQALDFDIEQASFEAREGREPAERCIRSTTSSPKKMMLRSIRASSLLWRLRRWAFNGFF